MDKIVLPQRPRILIVVLRRLGDVLLTTPLIRSVRRAWPDAQIDVLAFADTAAILDGNPDVSAVIAMPQSRSFRESFALVRRLWRRYDLAVSTQASDRATIFTLLAGCKRAGPVQARLSGRIFRLFFDRWTVFAGTRHRVQENLLYAGLLGIAPVTEMVAPASAIDASLAPARPYAVIHAAPFFRYKQWHREGWREIARHLMQQGFEVVATGGPGAQERAYLDDIWEGIGVRRLDGALSWPELGSLLAGTEVYVGPDTSVTHLAAAAGCPTIALFGPTDPRVWGPWPRAGLSAPWEKAGTIQQRGNVWLLQNPSPCTHFGLEGCLQRLDSYSRCLDELPARQVIAAIEQALATRPAARPEGGVAGQTPL
jgi:heptosyltransferase-3